jgi:pimeloyl-ACP methyl ester carboxylesterase
MRRILGLAAALAIAGGPAAAPTTALGPATLVRRSQLETPATHRPATLPGTSQNSGTTHTPAETSTTLRPRTALPPRTTPAPGATAEQGSRPSPGPIASSTKPCPTYEAPHFKCITLTVPWDHFRGGHGTTKVTFALRRHTAKGPARGVWVTVTGGPGTAGIWSAESYTSSFAASIRRNYDIVFFDQRGAGMSGGIQCPNAALAWYTSHASADDASAGADLKAAARTLSHDCIAESRLDRSKLPYYATRQAVEDLEAFRIWLGVKKMSIYGESYGSQFVQTYAAAHPHHVKVLFVDGPVDLERSGAAFYVEGARAFDNVLVATLLDCSTRVGCYSDVKGGNALTAYDKLATRLARAPIRYTFTRSNGSQVQRRFTLTDLQNAAADSMYSESDRELFQRAMVAASRGDVWWMARLDYAGLAQDPDTLQAIPDPSYSDALYYAVECVDYGYFTRAGTPGKQAAAYLRYGHNHGIDSTRLAADYYGDLPCVYWPAQPGPGARPPGLRHTPYRLVVLGATLDPATPFQNAQRIVSRNRAKSWLIYKPGGPHIIYGRGEGCPDKLVTNILIDGRFPTSRTTVCPGNVADAYVHVPGLADTRRGAARVLGHIDDEINAGVDYQYWDGAQPLVFGCPFGGTIRYATYGNGSRLKLDACEFIAGGAATGRGQIDDTHGTFRMHLTFSAAWRGTVTYVRNAHGHRTLHGRLHFHRG